jgi:hypothetical protein
LHIIKLTFNSLPGNQTYQFVDLRSLEHTQHFQIQSYPPELSLLNFLPPQLSPPSTSSLLNFITLHPTPSTSSHSINFIQLHPLHPTPSTSSNSTHFIPPYELHPTSSTSSHFMTFIPFPQFHLSINLSFLNFIKLTKPYHTPSRRWLLHTRVVGLESSLDLSLSTLRSLASSLASPFSVNSHSHKQTTFYWHKASPFLHTATANSHNYKRTTI